MISALFPRIGLIFFQTVVLLLLAFLLKRYAWVHILAFIKEEEEAHKKAQAEAAAANKKATRLQKSSENMLAKAERRSKDIIDNALATKEALLEEAKIEIEVARQAMLQKAQETIAQKEVASFNKLKEQSATLVVQTVQKLLVMELSQKNRQEALLHKLVEETAEAWQKPKS